MRNEGIKMLLSSEGANVRDMYKWPFRTNEYILCKHFTLRVR